MIELPHTDSFDPEDKDGIDSQPTSENGVETNAAHEETRPAEPVKLDIADPHFMPNAYETYAELRTKGPVSRVRFIAGEEEGDGAKEQRPDFLGRDTFFVTHYDEVVATLLDDRFSVDPRSMMSQEQLEKQPPIRE